MLLGKVIKYGITIFESYMNYISFLSYNMSNLGVQFLLLRHLPVSLCLPVFLSELVCSLILMLCELSVSFGFTPKEGFHGPLSRLVWASSSSYTSSSAGGRRGARKQKAAAPPSSSSQSDCDWTCAIFALSGLTPVALPCHWKRGDTQTHSTR